MGRVWLIGAAVLLASQAQAQTNTTCQWIGAQMHCQTRQPYQWQPQPQNFNQFGQGWDQGQRMWDNIAAAQQRREMQQRQQLDAAEAANRAMYEQMVGQAISEGRCEDAKGLALRQGDLDRAEQVVRLCSAR